MLRGLEEIRKDTEMVDAIDWDMTPEEAVTLYLEWGNNWSHGKMIKSRNDVSHYFVISTWHAHPRVFLVRRNSEEAVDLASIELPANLGSRFMKSVGYHKGIYGLSGEIRTWLEKGLKTGC